MVSLFKVLRLKKNGYLLLLLLIVISSSIIFFKISSSHRMPPDYNYDSDFGRDLLRMYEILQGKFTLIGPQLNFAGLHMAPYYFYIFAPFLLMSNFDHRILFYVNGLFFLLGFLVLFLFFKKKWGGTMPFYLLCGF